MFFCMGRHFLTLIGIKEYVLRFCQNFTDIISSPYQRHTRFFFCVVNELYTSRGYLYQHSKDARPFMFFHVPVTYPSASVELQEDSPDISKPTAFVRFAWHISGKGLDSVRRVSAKAKGMHSLQVFIHKQLENSVKVV